MADPTSGFDISSLIAPWMAQSPADLSQYGGAGQLGLGLLAAAGPTPYKQPFMSALANGALSSQQRALESAKARMGIAGQSIGLQQQMATFPFLMRALARMSGQRGAVTPDSSQTAPAPNPAQVAAAAQAQGNASPQANAPAPLTGGAPSGAAPAAPPAPQQAPAAFDPSRPPSGGDQADMSPFEESNVGALMALMGRPGGDVAQRDAAFRMQYNPNVQTATEFAKGPIAQDMMLLNAANAAKNPDMVRMANTKLQTDMGTNHIGSMSGIHTYQESDGSWTTDNPSTGLRVNSVRGVEYLNGALPAFAARENVEAAAKARGELTAETAPAGSAGSGSGGSGSAAPAQSSRPPSSAARAKPAAPAVQTPALEGHAAILDPTYIPPVLAAPGNTPQRPGATSLAALKVGQEHQAADAQATVDELNQKADAGNTLLTQTSQIRAAAASFTPGRYANVRGDVLAAIQGTPILRDALGPEQLKALGSYQEGSKLSIQLQAMVTKQLGSREAAQVFSTMGKTVPGLTLSGDGLEKISAYLDGMARYNIAMAQFGQRLMNQGNYVGAHSVENSFIANTNPTYYIMAAASPQVRTELLQSMPQAKRQAFLQAWDKAIKGGVAPKPNDYSDLGQ